MSIMSSLTHTWTFHRHSGEVNNTYFIINIMRDDEGNMLHIQNRLKSAITSETEPQKRRPLGHFTSSHVNLIVSVLFLFSDAVKGLFRNKAKKQAYIFKIMIMKRTNGKFYICKSHLVYWTWLFWYLQSQNTMNCVDFRNTEIKTTSILRTDTR